MEVFKTAKGRWAAFIFLSLPILLTLAIYHRESIGIPTPVQVVDTRNGDKYPFAVNDHLIRLKALALRDDDETHTFGKADAAKAIRGDGGNALWNVHTDDNRTLNNYVDSARDMFIFSKNSSRNAESLKNETGDGERTFGLKINDGMILAEDIEAEIKEKKIGINTREEEMLRVPPVGKDLSGYVSVVNHKNKLQMSCSKCAYVSSSGQLRGKGAGELIDSFPCVLRMNDAPVKGFERDVGSKTTVRIVAHSAIKFVYAKRQSILLGQGQPKYVLVWGPPDKMATNGKGQSYNVAASLSRDRSFSGTQFYMLTDQQHSYADKVFEIETGMNRMASGSWLSTGWFTMIFARAMCDEVHVFGMITDDHCKKNPLSRVPYHYYQPMSTKECNMYQSNEKAKNNGHRFMTEKAVFARWSKLQPKIFFQYPDWSAAD